MRKIVENFKKTLQYELFILIYKKHLTQAEAGEKLGLSQGQVSKSLKRLKARIFNFDEYRTGYIYKLDYYYCSNMAGSNDIISTNLCYKKR